MIIKYKTFKGVSGCPLFSLWQQGFSSEYISTKHNNNNEKSKKSCKKRGTIVNYMDKLEKYIRPQHMDIPAKFKEVNK